MSKAPELEVADQMLSVISAGTYSQTITAERIDSPSERIEDFLNKRHVQIIPNSLDTNHQNRGSWLDVVTIDVGLISMVNSEDQATRDALRWLREEIKREFIGGTKERMTLSPSGDTASLIDVQTIVPIWVERLQQTGGFIAVMQFRWKVM